jgi:plastocyanin
MTLITARPARFALAALGLAGLTLAAVPSTAGAARTGPAGGQNVIITDGKFVPDTIGVHPGQTVVWTNTDDAAHGITSTSGPEKFGTGDEVLKKAQTYQFTFTKPGTYNFECSVHCNGAGTVTVGENARTSASDDEDTPNGGLLGPLLPH